MLLYKRGRFILDALPCFEKAVAIDPDYALAWAGLADGHGTLGYFGMVAPQKTFPKANDHGLFKRAEFIMTEMRQGLENV